MKNASGSSTMKTNKIEDLINFTTKYRYKIMKFFSKGNTDDGFKT